MSPYDSTGQLLTGFPMNAQGVRLFRSLLAACLFAFTLGGDAWGQLPWGNCCPPAGLQDVSQVHVTYGGRIYLSFPNYDIFLNGAPRTLGDLATGGGATGGGATGEGEAGTGARVIYRTNSGMRFDGNEFFLHPQYPVEQITRQRYINRRIGEIGVEQQPGWRAPPAGTPAGYSSAYGGTSGLTGWAKTGTELNHRPVERQLFQGNAWVVGDHRATPTQPARSVTPGDAEAPPTPTTGRVRP